MRNIDINGRDLGIDTIRDTDRMQHTSLFGSYVSAYILCLEEARRCKSIMAN